ncbi:MAG: hypothetical protein HYR91_15505 [Flavobacteriia bacterium]|nr:hypothetical protein [Flavobacteriia bacterium]
MKIAITDACIFIDLYELDLTIPFFSLDFEIHTSLDVFNELYKEQQQVLLAFTSVGKLTTHVITSDERTEILSSHYPRALSEMDKTVLFLAEKHNAMVLSSDQVVRNHAKNKSIDYHGMLWIFDKLVEDGKITTAIAFSKLKQLIAENAIYRNNRKLAVELEKRLRLWG